ncbi:MAG: glycosyltransferase family 4 protein [Ilumatobacter sp.]
MVRVAIDAGPLHGPRTGIGNAVAWTLDALAASSNDAAGLDIVAYVTSMRAKVQRPQRRLPIPAALAHRLWARSSAIPMDRWLARPDVVHGTNYVVPPTKAPRIVSVYDCWFLDHPADAHPDVRRAGEVLRRSVADGATVATSSHATADRVRELLGVEAHTVHLGPPPVVPGPATRPAAIPPPLDSHPFVVAIGTAERRKNLPKLVDAFALVASEHPTAHLVLAGRDGDDSGSIARAISRLTPEAGERLVRLRDVDDVAKRWLLEHAAALAYPSLDEGFGFPVLEAQCVGTPVVASSAGSIPEVAGNAALLSLPNDAEALAANLHWVLTSEAQRDRLIRLGHHNVERFSWNATATALTTLYEQLAEEAHT